MTSIYHAGELAVQARAGVQAEALQLGKGISSIIKPAAQEFLRSQRLAIASTVDASDRVWASLLTGKPGFVEAVAQRTLWIDATSVYGDLLYENLLFSDEIGILAIDLATRRRLRLNGKAELHPHGGFYVHTRQVYFNCPQYIQAREFEAESTQSQPERSVQRIEALTEEQQHWIRQADTFFIASFHPEDGADVSHRGGYPGFIQVWNSNKLVFPDYAGNNMFNTLGNLLVNPKSGLLFIDFECGNTLQLTGRATVIWDTERRAAFAGAERVVEFEIEQAIAGTSRLRWRFVEYSPFNPA